MATSPYERPRYLTGLERRAFVETRTPPHGTPAPTPAAAQAVSSLDRLNALMHRKFLPSLSTGKIFDTVGSLRTLLTSPRPPLSSLKQRAADLESIATEWREADPDLYAAYTETQEPITDVVRALTPPETPQG